MINPVTSAGTSPVTELLAPASSAGGSGFGGLIERLLADAGAQQLHANQSVRDLAAGQTDSLHGVLLDVAKADLAFRMVLEIRNKLTDAYQEIMRMQV